MPSFAHLAVTKLDYSSIEERTSIAGQLGTLYDQDLGPVDELAKVQARRIAWELAQLGGPMTVETTGGEELRVDETQTVALIAYIQRLGTDLLAAEETVEEREPLTDEQQQVWDKYSDMLTYESIVAADVHDGGLR